MQEIENGPQQIKEQQYKAKFKREREKKNS